MYIHLDADSLLYKAAACVQHNVYKDTCGHEYNTLADLTAAGGTIADKRLELTMPAEEALEQAYIILNTAIKSMVWKLTNKLYPDGNADKALSLHFYISSSTNFRYNISPLYKANRDPSTKPLLLSPVKRYFINKYKPLIVDNFEADDIASTCHVNCIKSGYDSVLVHIDKDLDNVVGSHYNPDKDLLYTVTPQLAIIHYYRQVLVGDVADNVKGIKGLGPAAAAKLIPLEWATEQDYKLLQKRCHKVALDVYTKHNRLVDLKMNMDLLHIRTNVEV